MSHPKTALLVPCYNAVDYLPRLQQQLEQLNPKFDEVLLVDDASTDNTADAARSMGLNIISLNENQGPGGARNALAQATNAEWIHFHDVDDEIAPDYLNHVLPVADTKTDVVLHFTDFIQEADRSPIIRWQYNPEQLRSNPADTLLRNPMPTMSSFLRRESFLQVGGFHPKRRCFEDGDFHLKLAMHGCRIQPVPEVLEWSLRHDAGAGADQLYCFHCRTEFLEDYATSFPEDLHLSIASEAEHTARQLLLLKDRETAARAIRIASQLGYPVPASQHVLIRALRHIIPAITLLRIQEQWRQFWKK